MGRGIDADKALDMALDLALDASNAKTDPKPTIQVVERSDDGFAAIFGGNGATAEPSETVTVIKRRKRRYGPRVAYQLTSKARALANGKGTKAEREAVTNLFPTAANCLKVIAKAKRPMTNRDVEKASGEKQKTVESCVYALRHAGLIESVAIPENGK